MGIDFFFGPGYISNEPRPLSSHRNRGRRGALAPLHSYPHRFYVFDPDQFPLAGVICYSAVEAKSRASTSMTIAVNTTRIG